MTDANWDDLHVFFHVAEAGGLSGAAKRTGLSAPTLGRRMVALEQAAGRQFFLRAQTGYTLTDDGRALLERVRVMRSAAMPVEAYLSQAAEAPMIRISAGTATAQFLIRNIRALSQRGDPFRLRFVTSEAILDIGHREIDLGIRNRPAEAQNAASRKLGILRFAPYCSVSVAPETLDWVALDRDTARHPAAKWIHRQDVRVAVEASSVATLHDLIRAGAGIGLMPCMIGDCDPTLARAGPIVEDLTETQFLVMHDDDRHRAPMRTLIDRVVRVYADNAAILSGARPMPG
ncbi:MAG: LysR family transcriptional regulator [Pseudomonadota bacterium]